MAEDLNYLLQPGNKGTLLFQALECSSASLGNIIWNLPQDSFFSLCSAYQLLFCSHSSVKFHEVVNQFLLTSCINRVSEHFVLLSTNTPFCCSICTVSRVMIPMYQHQSMVTLCCFLNFCPYLHSWRYYLCPHSPSCSLLNNHLLLSPFQSDWDQPQQKWKIYIILKPKMPWSDFA